MRLVRNKNTSLDENELHWKDETFDMTGGLPQEIPPIRV
jgi:hypothetical protein